MNASAPRAARGWAACVIAATVASCSTVTGGTALPHHSTASPPAPAAAPPSSPGPPAPPAPASPEDQIRVTLNQFQDAYNTENWDAYLELMCTAMRVKFSGSVLDYTKKYRAETGISTIKAITSISITGDTATAVTQGQNETLGIRTITMPLKLEDGWKICKTD
jgi:hypothetical protein